MSSQQNKKRLATASKDVILTASVVPPHQKSKAPKKKKKNKGNPGSSRSQSSLALDWARCLSDPFQYTAPKLGMGTMVPTEVATLYKRGSIIANGTDGSFALALMPYVDVSTAGPVVYSIGLKSAVINSYGTFDNLAAFTGQYGAQAEMRVIAGGIRVMPSVAATAAPGEIYAGAIPSTTTSLLSALTPNAVSTLPFTHSGVASDGAVVTARPQDVDSFVFVPSTATTSVYGNWSTPYIIGIGLPVSTPVFYEMVLHVEVLPGASDVSCSGASATYDPSNVLKFGSMEQLFAQTSEFVESATQLTSRFTTLTNGLSAAGGAVAGLAGRYALMRGRANNKFVS